MIYQYTSSKTVIARVGRFVVGSSWQAIGSMYLGDGIQELGYSTRRKNKVESKALTVANHQVEIPCELEILESVHKDGCRLGLNRDSRMLALTCDDYYWDNQSTNWYMIEPPFIRTSFESGDIEIFYRSFEFDEDGYIMIPDIPAYRNALVWHILSQLILEGVQLKDKTINYSFAQNEYEKFEHKAKAKVRRFSRDERENFARMWTSRTVEGVQNVYRS